MLTSTTFRNGFNRDIGVAYTILGRKRDQCVYTACESFDSDSTAIYAVDIATSIALLERTTVLGLRIFDLQTRVGYPKHDLLVQPGYYIFEEVTFRPNTDASGLRVYKRLCVKCPWQVPGLFQEFIDGIPQQISDRNPETTF